MAIASQLVKATGKAFKKLGKPTRVFLEEGVEQANVPGLVKLAADNPPEFQKWLNHADNFASRGEQGGLIEMIGIEDTANSALRDLNYRADTLKKIETPVDQQLPRGENRDKLRIGERQQNLQTTVPGRDKIMGRGEPFRAHKASKTQGARSIISAVPQTISKNYPDRIEEAVGWTRDVYDYARSAASGDMSQPLKGAPRFVGDDGVIFKGKTSTGSKGGYQLKFVKTDLLAGYAKLRQFREAPWNKQHVIDELLGILNEKGLGDKLEDLLKLMIKEYNEKLNSIPKGETKGHYISLAKGGLDIAENFGPQRGKSIKKGGEWQVGNYAEAEDSAIPEGIVPIQSWAEYIDLKLPQLTKK